MYVCYLTIDRYNIIFAFKMAKPVWSFRYIMLCSLVSQMQGAIREAVLNSNPMLWLFDPAQVCILLFVYVRESVYMQF